jgi:hypothetical protein
LADPKLFQVKEADCVVIVGGADSSYGAGVAAAVSGKQIVPIGSFGGAGKRLINLFASTRAAWRSNLPTEDELGQLHGPWTEYLLEQALGLLRLTNFPKLLIIHGRSEDRFKLKNYLQNILALPEPVIMGERPMIGRTLPEKFESLAHQTDGAIALVTPDDVGGLAEAPSGAARTEALDREPPERRARQNVWLEVGWFWGRFGRDRFFLLCRDNTVIPSDLSGIEYFPYRGEPSEQGEAMREFVRTLGATLS